MSGGEVIALVSVVVTGGLSPYIASSLARRAAEHTSTLAREDELRSALDAAGIRLTDAVRTFEIAAESAQGSVGQAALAPLEPQLEQLQMNYVRLAVRVGVEAPETSVYHAAIETLRTLDADLWAESRGESSSLQVNATVRLSKVQQLSSQFFEAASSRVGPKS